MILISLPRNILFALRGACFGLLFFLIFKYTEGLNVNYRLAHLLYLLSSLIMCVPAIMANLVNYNLVPIFTVVYWGIVGYLFSKVHKRSKVILFFILLVHIIVFGGVNLAFKLAIEGIIQKIFGQQ